MNAASIASVTAIGVGFVLVVAALGKLRDPDDFARAVRQYRVLPPTLGDIYARLVPFAEVLCGLALIAGRWPHATSALAALLFSSFLLAVSFNLARGRSLDCHCFGSHHGEHLGWTTVVRLLALLAGVAVVARWAAPGWLFAHPSAVIPALSLGAGCALALYLLGAIPLGWEAFRALPQESSRVRSQRESLRGLTG